MAIFAELADGRRLEFPDGTDPAVIQRTVKRIIASETPPAEGVGAAFRGGLEGLLSRARTGIEGIFDPEEAARRGLERGEDIGQRFAPGASLQRVKDVYAERGLFPAAGEALSQIPSALAEQAPNIAATLGSAKLGAMAGTAALPGVGTVIGGVGGALAPSLLQLFGGNIERQAEAQAESGQPLDISRGAALAAAAPGAALEVASTFIPLGRTLVGKLLGPEATKAMARSTAEGREKIAQEGLLKVLGKGTAVGAAVEIPTEVTQQMLERLQAGLPITSDDAYAEYAEAAYGAGLVGGPFGAAGRAGQRSVARGEIEQEQAKVRAEDAKKAAEEDRLAKEAEEARKATPEYRQEINAQLVEKKDRLRELEQLLKDKTTDEDVKNEAKTEAKQLRKELGDLNKQMKESMTKAGIAPTVESALKRQKIQIEQQQPIVDDFGNVVQPKTTGLTPEQEAEGYERQAAKTLEYFAEREEALARLRAEAEAEREAEYENLQQQIKTMMEQTQQLEEESGVEVARRGEARRTQKEQEVQQEMSINRMQRIVDELGLRAADLKITPDERAKIESFINEGVVNRFVTGALGIKGLGGRTVNAAQALPNIDARIQELQDERQKALVGTDPLLLDTGSPTKKGFRLMGVEAQLNELRRLRMVAEQQAPAETGAESAIEGTLQAAASAQAEPVAVEIEQGLPKRTYEIESEKANKAASGSFTNLLSFMDDYRQGRFFGEGAAPGQLGLASSTREGLLGQSEVLRKEVVDSLIQEVAYSRMQQGLAPLTRDEGIALGLQVDSILNEIITRSTALPRRAALKEIVISPAQVRGTEIIKSAKTIFTDPRPLSERQFGAPKRALEVLAEGIRQSKEQAIEAGKRPIRAEKPLLRQQFRTQETETEYAQTDRVVEEIGRVLAMPNLDPQVAQVLDRAATVIANENVNPTFLNTVDEQVGRILRGIDKPFTPVADPTQPARRPTADRQAMLINEIQQDMDNEVAVSAAAMQDITTQAQGDMFAEDLATIRATPGMLRRLQKSRKVVKERERIAKEKAETEQTRRAALQAKREVDFEFSDEGIKQKQQEILDRIKTLAAQIQDNEGYSEVTVKNFKYKWVKSKDPDAIAAYKKEQARYDKTKPEDRTRMRVPFPPGSWEIVGPSTGRYTKRVATMSDRVASQWAALDEDIKKEVANLRELERKVRAIKEKSEQRKAAARAATQQRQLVSKVKQGQAKLLQDQKQVEADLFKTLERAQAGLGLPGIRAERKTPEEIAKEIAEARAERKKTIKAAGAKTKEEKAAIPLKLKSRFKVAAIKSAEEIEADRLAAVQTGARKLGQVASPEDVQIKVQEEFGKALKNRDKAKKELDDFRKLVNEAKGAKDFAKYEKEFFTKLKELSAVVNVAQAKYVSARYNLDLINKTTIREFKGRRETAPRTIAGPITEAQKSYTPEQLSMLTGMPANMMPRITTAVDDDTTKFAIGDSKPETSVDFAEAEKRLKEVKALAKKMGVEVKIYPSVADAPTDISRAMARQDLDPLIDSVKGGVLPNGDVFIIVDAHSNMLDLEQTVAHELVGHYSFESMLGKDGMMELMRKVDKSFATKENQNGLENLADSLGLRDQYNAAIVGAYNFYRTSLDKGELTETEVRRLAKTDGLREIIAYTMEKRVDQSFMQKAKRWLQELTGAFRALLKRLGLVDAANMSTSDLFYLMRQAHDNFTAGKPMAFTKPDGTVSFSSVAASAPQTGLSAMIASKGKVYDKIKGNVTGLAARVQFFDRLAALDALVKRGVEKGVIDSLKAMDVLYFSRMADQRNNFVAQFATSGVGKISLKDGERMYTGGDGPSLKDVSQALSKSGVPSKNVENEFTEYLLAVRAKRVGADKLDFTGKKATQKQVEDTVARYSGTDPASMAFQKARDLYRDYNNNLIDFVVSSGAMSKEKGEALKAPGDYVPFYRQVGGRVELVVMGEKPIRIGDITSQPYLQALVGGETTVLPVFTSALQNTSMLVDMALKNMAARNTAFVLRDMGVAKIQDGKGPDNVKVIRFSVEEKDASGKPKHKEKYAIIDTKMKEELFGDIPTELVVQGMEGIKAVVPAGIQLLGLPANWLRKFVTRDPRYAIRQIFRDSMASVLTTGANFVPVVQTLKDMATMKKSGTLEKLRESGVVGGQVITGASDDMAKILQQLASGKPGWDMAMAKLDEFAMMGDAATRVSMYNSFLRQGLSDREATFATLEAMNFGRRGLSPTVLYANTLIPFFNAGLQGIDVLYRAFKRDMPFNERLQVKKKLLARGAMMGLLTMSYAAAMEDEEEYKNANPDERYNNWFVPTPFGVLRVPIPFEAGLVFKGIPEGVYRMAFTDDKNADVLIALKDLAMRSIPGDVPTAIKPIIELNLNKSLFTNREIVDASLPEEAKYQYRPNTPELIKLFGSIGLSPVQVEYFIKSYTGGLLVGTMRVFDPVLGGELVKPDMRITDVPILGGLFQPKDAGGIINAAYKTAQSAQAAQRTYNRLQQEDPEEAQRYFQSALNNLSLASSSGQFKQQMSVITQSERSIRAAKTMTGEEKREKLDELRQEKIKMATMFNNVKAQIERQASRSGLQ